jgi:aspartyl protease family protein
MKKSHLLLASLLCFSSATSVAAPYVVVIGLMGDKAILRVDDEQVMITKGETKNGITLRDVNSREATLLIGKKEQKLGLGKDTGAISARADGARVDIVMSQNGQYLTNGMINGRIVQFLVDTGANMLSMTTEDARNLGIDYRRVGEESRSMTAGGLVRAWNVRLAKVQIGPITVNQVEASIREAPSFGPILLGMSFLGRLDMQHEQNRLSLKER